MKKLLFMIFILAVQSCELNASRELHVVDIFKTSAGVECIFREQGMHGVSCNWEKWNKETNYQSIVNGEE